MHSPLHVHLSYTDLPMAPPLFALQPPHPSGHHSRHCCARAPETARNRTASAASDSALDHLGQGQIIPPVGLLPPPPRYHYKTAKTAAVGEAACCRKAALRMVMLVVAVHSAPSPDTRNDTGCLHFSYACSCPTASYCLYSPSPSSSAGAPSGISFFSCLVSFSVSAAFSAASTSGVTSGDVRSGYFFWACRKSRLSRSASYCSASASLFATC